MQAQDTLLGLPTLFREIQKLQKFEITNSKLYQLDDLFAPHNSLNPRQPEGGFDPASSLSTIRSEELEDQPPEQ